MDLIFGFLSLLDDIRFGKRFGYGGLIWSMAAFLIITVTIGFFAAKWYLLGAIGIICFVLCQVFAIRWDLKNIKKARNTKNEACEKEKKEN